MSRMEGTCVICTIKHVCTSLFVICTKSQSSGGGGQIQPRVFSAPGLAFSDHLTCFPPKQTMLCPPVESHRLPCGCYYHLRIPSGLTIDSGDHGWLLRGFTWCTRADRQCLRSFNSPGGEPAWGSWDARILCLGQEILLLEGQNHRDGDGYAKAFFCYTASQGASDPPPWRSLFTIIIRNSALENNPSVKIPLFL